MAEYVCELTDDYPDVPFGRDDYSGTVALRERLKRIGIEVGYSEIRVPIVEEGDGDGD